MFQYAKKVLNETVKEYKQRKIQKEQEKDEFDRKVVAITNHERLKRILKKEKKAVLIAVVTLMSLTGFIIQLGIANQASLLKTLISVTFLNGYLSCIVSDIFTDYFKHKQEYEKLSEEEYNGLKKNEEEFKELVQELETEISNIEAAIIKFEKELDNISILEENQKANFMNNPLYLADTKEEYDLLTNRKYEQAWNEFLNERIDYPSVHLEVKEAESANVKALIKKV